MELSAIGIVCPSLEASIRFYESFGLKFQQSGGADHFEAKTPSGLRVMLDSVELIKSFNPNWKQPEQSSMMLAFEQKTPSDVDNLFQKLTTNGHPSIKEPWNAFWGQRYACIRSPEGNQVDIFANL